MTKLPAGAPSRTAGYKTRRHLPAGEGSAQAVPGAVAARHLPVGRRRATSARSTRCSTPCRPTSRRAWSRATARPPTWPSASGSQSLEEQKKVVDRIKERLDPPHGRDAPPWSACPCWRRTPTPRCPPRCAARSPCSRRWLAVFLVLLAFRRSRREAAVPLIPIALATGWSAGMLFLLGLLPGPLDGQAEPDVGHARRARDRDLHRVQRAAVRPLPPGARGRRAAGARDRAAPTPPPARRCWRRAPPPSPASPR